MIYFDNAATGSFKPEKAIGYAVNAIKKLNVNPGRNSSRTGKKASELIYGTRKILSEYFNNGSADRVVFTHNCTSALNTALFGYIKNGMKVITTVTEHNAVLRPLYRLAGQRDAHVVFVSPKGKYVTADDVREVLSKDVGAIVCNYVSNVTGYENDIPAIGALAEEINAAFIVDAAQCAGHKTIDMKKDKIDVLCAAGHKGMMATQGVGILAFNEKIDIEPLFYGGTGTDSFNNSMPDYYPEKLEAGTMNLPAICSLYGAMEYLRAHGEENAARIYSLTNELHAMLSEKKYLRLYSEPNEYGIVSFSHEAADSQTVAQILSDEYDIAVRGGFHCAPLLHKHLGTSGKGLVRVSLSAQNDKSEIYALIKALDDMTFNL